MIKNESIGCDFFGQYMYINLKAGNETKIEQVGPVCYDVIINDCEVLPGVERLMLEIFVKRNNQLQNISN